MPRVAVNRLLVALMTISLALVAASCDDTNDDRRTGSTTSTADVAALGAEPRYAEPGPYEVGVTTLALSGDRKVEVYYPAVEASTDGKPNEVYNQTDPIPPDVLAALPPIPPGLDLTQEIPAVRDVPVATDGPFPLVLFSHGAGGWRGVYGHPLSGIASWGFIVASVDFSEYGILAQFGAADPNARAGVGDVAGAAIDLMLAENERTDGPFAGTIDGDHIAAMGHSAGAGTMFALAGDDERVGAVVGWAPAGSPENVPADTPTLIVAGQRDIAVPPERARSVYAALPAPKRVALVAKMGHNGFSDACLPIRNGTDLIGIAKSLNLPIPDSTLELGRNGCAAGDLDTQQGWDITQHFTVAHLRAAFGIDSPPVGLGDGIATAFDGVTIDYQHEP